MALGNQTLDLKYTIDAQFLNFTLFCSSKLESLMYLYFVCMGACVYVYHMHAVPLQVDRVLDLLELKL